MKMSKPNSEYIESRIEKEGFHYAFVGYSDFEEVEDAKFHELRKKYLEATKELGEYMNLPPNFYE
jgi:hypothetical protein